jgi:threonine dehydratase
VRALTGAARVVGVQAAGAAAYPPSLAQGEPVPLVEMSTIADGIAANCPGELTFAHVQTLVDDIVCVTDEAIAEALVFAAERMKLVLEPAGAAGVAAVLQGAGDLVPPVVVVLSGGNIDPLLLQRVVRFGLSASGRYFAFHTRIPDRPGELVKLLSLIARERVNVVSIEHHREGMEVPVAETEVELTLITRDEEHCAVLIDTMRSWGYGVERVK